MSNSKKIGEANSNCMLDLKGEGYLSPTPLNGKAIRQKGAVNRFNIDPNRGTECFESEGNIGGATVHIDIKVAFRARRFNGKKLYALRIIDVHRERRYCRQG